jgi:hypothetical protein
LNYPHLTHFKPAEKIKAARPQIEVIEETKPALKQ